MFRELVPAPQPSYNAGTVRARGNLWFVNGKTAGVTPCVRSQVTAEFSRRRWNTSIPAEDCRRMHGVRCWRGRDTPTTHAVTNHKNIPGEQKQDRAVPRKRR